ncbi:hypothetical protein CEXT_730271 [Caerostris extrusa]|uniref:Uncharacterized protein n=1 Tax=Caerostris extrusa TaxID=172846 RepID=A0AAV4NQQ4_CAEEX|nr:hypothetical protein CEXT_730271 [Caerostris extrusa]
MKINKTFSAKLLNDILAFPIFLSSKISSNAIIKLLIVNFKDYWISLQFVFLTALKKEHNSIKWHVKNL